MRQPVPIRAPFGGLVTNPAFRTVDPRHSVDNLNVHTAWGAIEKRRGFTQFSTNRANDLSVAIRGFRLKSTSYVFSLAQASMSVFNAVTGVREFDYLLPAGIGDGFIAMEQYGGVVYVGGDANTQQKIYANGAVLNRARIGIVAPTLSPTVGGHFGGATTFPLGTYSYRYTYYSAVTGTESGPGPEGTRVVGGPNEHNDVTPTASADTQVSNIRLYRKLNGTDSTWFFVASLPNTTTLYHDENVTIAKTLNDALNVVTGLPPAVSYFLIAYKDRMFWRDDSGIANTTDFNDLVCSEFQRPENVNVNNRFRFGNAQNDGIVGGIVAFGALVIFCRKSIWMLVGDGPSSFSREKIVDGVGCIDRDTIRSDPRTGVIYFCDDMGAFSFDGSGVKYLSHNVQSVYRTIPQNRPISAGFDTRAGLYIISGAFPGEEYAKQLVYDPAGGNWFVWKMDAKKFGDLRTPNKSLFMGGQAFPGINLYRGPTGDTEADYGTTPIAWRWQTPKIDFGSTRRKVVRYASVAWGGESATETITLKHGIDDNPVDRPVAKTRAGRPQMKKWRLGRRCDSIQLELSGASSIATRITAIDLDAEQVGHR